MTITTSGASGIKPQTTWAALTNPSILNLAVEETRQAKHLVAMSAAVNVFVRTAN
jgi:hypothetical protein